jgi:hypothetical protein
MRVTLTVKQDESLDPINVSLFRSRVVVAGSNRLAYLIEESWLGDSQFALGRLHQ